MGTIAHLNSALAGRYEIERELGAGVMATVFLGRDLGHDCHGATGHRLFLLIAYVRQLIPQSDAHT